MGKEEAVKRRAEGEIKKRTNEASEGKRKRHDKRHTAYHFFLKVFQ